MTPKGSSGPCKGENHPDTQINQEGMTAQINATDDFECFDGLDGSEASRAPNDSNNFNGLHSSMVLQDDGKLMSSMDSQKSRSNQTGFEDPMDDDAKVGSNNAHDLEYHSSMIEKLEQMGIDQDTICYLKGILFKSKQRNTIHHKSWLTISAFFGEHQCNHCLRRFKGKGQLTNHLIHQCPGCSLNHDTKKIYPQLFFPDPFTDEMRPICILCGIKDPRNDCLPS